jgi:hypothetical protein
MNKEELIEKYRYINVEHGEDWHDFVFEGFIERMRKVGIGIEASNIQYSGFCSQGDGASFTCYIDGENFDLFCKAHQLYDDYPVLMVSLAYGNDPYITTTRSNWRYSHANTVTAEVGQTYDFLGQCDATMDEHDARFIMMDAFDDQFDDMFTDRRVGETVDTTVGNILRGYMEELYIELNDQYYHLISDDSVWDCIVSNDLHEEVECA